MLPSPSPSFHTPPPYPQDVMLFSLPPAGAGAAASHAVLATALSQRHAYAAAHAVRYQVSERAYLYTYACVRFLCFPTSSMR